MRTSTPPQSGGSQVGKSTIPVFKPLIRQEEIGAAVEALEMGWLGMGAYVGEFEEAWRRTIETDDRRVVALATGHAALHLGLVLAGVGPGDEVITPAFNNIADFQAILAVGASPVFCDVDDATLCIDLDEAETLVGEKTRAIIATDYACQLCDHDAIKGFADTRGLRVLHDAAHSLGSRHNGRAVGSFSDLCMFSFDPIKTITCIDGGALVVRTEEEAQSLCEMRLIGMTQPTSVMYRNQRAWTYDVTRHGFRYHMANLHAAIGLAQLAKLDGIVDSRRAACQRYNEQLADLDCVRTPDTDFRDFAPFLYYIRVSEDRREDLRGHLRNEGIDTGIHWRPGHWFSLFRNCRHGDLSNTERIGRQIVTLPLHSDMDLSTVDRIVRGIRGFWAA